MSSRIRMHRALRIAVIIGLLTGGVTASADASVGAPRSAEPTTWAGTLDAGGAKLRLEVEIIDTDGELTGKLRSLDQGNSEFPLSDLVADGTTFAFSIPSLGASFSGAYNDDGTSATGTFSQGGNQLPLTLTKSTADTAAAEPGRLREAWVGTLQMGMQNPVMQFRIVEFESGETTVFFDSVTEGRTGFPATWSIEGDALSFDVAAIQLTYRGTLNAARDTAEGTWSQGGRDVPLTLTKQADGFESANLWENRPQRPKAPFPYDEEEVRFVNSTDDVTLAGTLTIPKTGSRHPAVVLISGSGAQDRDETLLEHKPFLVLADHLSRRGIAVLRYDDRGTAGSTGSFGAATSEDFARDASAAIEFLLTHDRIDPARIGLAGHSEGGLVAPMVVNEREDVAFAVLLAAPGVDGATIIESQTEAMLRAGGTPESEIAIAQTINRAATKAAMNATPGTDIAAEVDPVIEGIVAEFPEANRELAREQLRQGVRNAVGRLESDWMQFFLAYDPRPALQHMDCPVLVLFGSNDLQVLPALNIPEIERALTEGGNEHFEIVELEGLNHLFQTSETGAMTEYADIQETFNPEALRTIGDWLATYAFGAALTDGTSGS